MATVGDLAGMPQPAGNEGRSLGPVLRGEARAVRDELLLAYRDVQRALVRPRWKLIDYPRAGRRQLFDLDADPQECHDLWADAAHAETRRTMQDGLGEAERAAGDPLAVGR
ncbi:MAG: DUF4976 domain-containing protein [Planctomycetia bacterium]|nr:DUF4976 domain-containing protein [Planctomycetia bacterium]